MAPVLVAAPAAAYPTFPGAMQERLDLTCPPSCLLCHTRLEGGKDYLKDGPEISPVRGNGVFVQNLRFVGQKLRTPISNDEVAPFEKLLDAYATAPCDGNAGTPPCDSDGDGVSDIAELKENKDPESLRGTLDDCVLYGCGAHIAPRRGFDVSGSSVGAWFAALGGLLVVGRRVRRRSRA